MLICMAAICNYNSTAWIYYVPWEGQGDISKELAAMQTCLGRKSVEQSTLTSSSVSLPIRALRVSSTLEQTRSSRFFFLKSRG